MKENSPLLPSPQVLLPYQIYPHPSITKVYHLSNKKDFASQVMNSIHEISRAPNLELIVSQSRSECTVQERVWSELKQTSCRNKEKI